MNNIREENILGGKRVIVGNPTSDLVLETLGKVFIKQGRSFVDFNTYMKNIQSVSSKKSEAENNVIICTRDQLNDLKTNYPGDGKLIFNTDDLTLYICSEGEVLPLIEVNFKDSYVKKAGDVMTGQLEIEYLGSPLKVKSTSLVKNFNTEFLNGYSSAEVAIKKRDEIIEGKWDFYRPTTFRDNTYHYGASNIFTGSLQSRDFISGYLGSGWKLDAYSNTLTIDNLIVRKVLSVYELVVNKISALTGNFWVTNCAKCTGAVRIENSDSTEFVYKFYVEPQENVTPTTITHQNFNELVGGRYDFVSADGKIESKIKCNKILNVDGNIYDIINPSLEVDPSNTKKNYFNYILNAETAFLTRNLPTDPYTVSSTYLYDKYFKRDTSVYPAIPGGELWVMEFKEEEYPTFKPGDLIRCQKAEGKGQSFEIKYYDALILNSISGRDFIVQLTRAATSDGTSFNTDSLYEQSPSQTESRLGEPAADDAIVQIGNIFDTARQGSIYLTNSDNEAPYIDILDEVNRVDFSVISNESYVPRWKKVKANGIKQQNSSDPIQTWDKYKSFYFANKSKSAFINSPYFQGYGVKRGDSDDIIDFYKTFSGDNYNYLILSYPVYNGNYCEIETDDENNYIQDYRKNTKVRLGKLDGIYDSTFPADKQPYGYGLYGENVFLTGEFYLNNGKSVVDFSQEGIFMAFEEAGLEITTDEHWIMEKKNQEQDWEEVIQDRNNYVIENDNGIKVVYNGTVQTNPVEQDPYYYYYDDGSPYLRVYQTNNHSSIINLMGDKIYIYTTVQGDLVPTALFEDGYFNTSLIRVTEIESRAAAESKYTFKEENGKWVFDDVNPAVEMPVWKLFQDGHGYLAKGNIRWQEDGDIELRGIINAEGFGNGFSFSDENNNPKVILGTSRNKDEDSWTNESDSYKNEADAEKKQASQKNWCCTDTISLASTYIKNDYYVSLDEYEVVLKYQNTTSTDLELSILVELIENNSTIGSVSGTIFPYFKGNTEFGFYLKSPISFQINQNGDSTKTYSIKIWVEEVNKGTLSSAIYFSQYLSKYKCSIYKTQKNAILIEPDCLYVDIRNNNDSSITNLDVHKESINMMLKVTDELNSNVSYNNTFDINSLGINMGCAKGSNNTLIIMNDKKIELLRGGSEIKGILINSSGVTITGDLTVRGQIRSNNTSVGSVSNIDQLLDTPTIQQT